MVATKEVKGAFVGGWKPLEPEDESTDAEKAGILAVGSALKDELGAILGAENLVVLAGLGTSLSIPNYEAGHLGAPTMSDLWRDVVVLPELNAIRGTLNPAILATENLEYVLSDAQARAALATAPGDPELQAFISAAEDIIWKRCNFVDEGSGLEVHELFLRKVARRSTRMQRAQLYTTNYDLAFETAAARAHFNVIDGFGFSSQEFDGASFDLDFVRRRQNEPLSLEPNVFHLLKLHGSVDWNADGDRVRRVCGGMRPADPVLIYPSAAKYQLSFRQPYLEFMSRFQSALRQPDVGVLIVGFGFNDEHLVAPLEAALRSNVGLRIAIVSPGIRAAGRSASLGWIERLVDQGDRRITLLAATFEELVRLLPDTPAKEEREAHALRVLAAGGRT
ncbi:SIR2 family protein [Rathayibacter sp. VKM Ac-2759]|uniref:SIR2 family protein n=1 Tax=Rathayibacter sp. VKM Ac-2759 TaxID=2609252 RepID=UPI001318B798|nr:SIR2 family protein [Rathayibacter sp. VKM Ac-2759]QHC67362.1 SIR2 family protein [Rathayibacter sp. VKM Ac-2759]